MWSIYGDTLLKEGQLWIIEVFYGEFLLYFAFFNFKKANKIRFYF